VLITAFIVGTEFELPAESESIDLLVHNYMFDLISFEDSKSWASGKSVYPSPGHPRMALGLNGYRF
jgi:hypothetical protein